MKLTSSNLTKYPIIPLPAVIHPMDGYFYLSNETRILYDTANLNNAKYLRSLLINPTGYELIISELSNQSKNSIILKIDPSLNHLGNEGYYLDISQDIILIISISSSGAFYAIQSLRQLLPVDIEEQKAIYGYSWNVPCCKITDQPRFRWRGFMLDEGRHFQGEEIVCKTLDLMALHKLNVFHWHLTEDQGWRIEIKNFPRLTEKGSKRIGTANSWKIISKPSHDRVFYSGFYTQDQIKKIINYASERNINIIPEIDIPGHSTALISSYPQLSCKGKQVKVSPNFGIHKEILCAGKESTYQFLESVFDEISSLFPSPYIHIGGDEVPKSRWKKCPDCQRRIRDHNLEDEKHLQIYFFNRVASFLESESRIAIGWNQITHKDLTKKAIVQFWLGNKNALRQFINRGHQVINSDYFHAYLDHSYLLTPLKKAYNFDPGIIGINIDQILGLEALAWTEWIHNQDRLDYQVHPRMSALAETSWSLQKRKAYEGFIIRMGLLLERLDRMKVKYAPKEVWDSPWYKRLLGYPSIALPQRKTRE